MHHSPTLIRRGSGGASAPPYRDDNDPVLVASIRSRVAALAALAGSAYTIAFPLDLVMHASFGLPGLTSPARLKNLAMALLAWWVHLAARRASLSLTGLTQLAYLLVFLMGLHQTLEALHFFQWSPPPPGALAVKPGAGLPSLIDGLPWTCLFMVLFPPFVPGSPRKHLLLGLSLAAPLLVLPLGWAATSGLSYWSILSPETFANVPISVVLSLFMSIAIHRIDTALRRERRRSRELGSYELLRELGRGGMGQVWLARHKMLARPAALKLIKTDRIEASADKSTSLLRRFEREARATAHLRSTHTVELYDFGRTDAGDFYYVMELLDGLDLDALVKRDGPQPAWRVTRILSQVCLSLAEAHEQGLIHRDVKPANIFLCRQGAELDVVKVLDFGLVAAAPQVDPSGASALTREDDILGTPAFMAPEMVLSPAEVDHRSDLYALGCVGYWLVAGRHLFEGDTLVALLYAHAHKEPPAPLFPEALAVPLGLEALLLGLLAKSPERRPESAREVFKRLQEIETSGAWSEAQLRDWWSALPSPPNNGAEAAPPDRSAASSPPDAP